jgi:hypothetical protein
VRLNELLAWLRPGLKDRVDGIMDFQGEFTAALLADTAPWQALRGSGAAVLRYGTIRDFNLLARLFDRTGAELENERKSPELQALLARPDTPVEDFRAALRVDQERVRGESVSLRTPEYAISGAGWIGFDGTTQWKGVLTFTPDTSRKLQGEYRALRYFLDRKGSLAVSFRADGKLPDVRVRPENRALGQALRWGGGQRADDSSGRQGGGKMWLPDSLERLLHR